MAYDSLTWEPAKVGNGLQAQEEFHQRYPRKPKLWGNNLGGRRAKGGDTVTGLGSTEVLGNNAREIGTVWKELCYGKMEKLGDVEEAAGWWRDNLVQLESGLRCCDVG